jgi:hypothetical protein
MAGRELAAHRANKVFQLLKDQIFPVGLSNTLLDPPDPMTPTPLVFYICDFTPRAFDRGVNGILDDADGVLWVGATPPGRNYYEGLLQDVRMFHHSLDDV